MNKTKRSWLEKLEILDEIDAGLPLPQAIQKYNFTLSTYYVWKRNRAEYEKMLLSFQSSGNQKLNSYIQNKQVAYLERLEQEKKQNDLQLQNQYQVEIEISEEAERIRTKLSGRPRRLDNHPEVGKRLKKVREILGLTQAEFAEKTGFSQRAIYCMEANITTLGLENFIKFYSVFGINPNYLILGKEHMFISSNPFPIAQEKLEQIKKERLSKKEIDGFLQEKNNQQ